MAQPRRRLWQSAAGQAVVGPCSPRAVEGPSRSVVATVFFLRPEWIREREGSNDKHRSRKDAQFYRRC